MDTDLGTGAFITCRTSQDQELHATPVHLSRFHVTFQLHNPATVLRTSEVLEQFKLSIGERVLYSGRVTITSLVNTGGGLVAEATLEDAWRMSPPTGADRAAEAQAGYARFLAAWQKLYRILPEYKMLVADMQTFLMDLRSWLNQEELALRAAPTSQQAALESETLAALSPRVIQSLNGLFEQFETIAARVDEEARAAHRLHLQRTLHPLVMSSPFAWRTFTKPLGYAGDYEMVNMLFRDPFEGGSLYARLLNAWFISQPPAEAHRNRIRHLSRRLLEETVRAVSAGRPASVFDVGCGPAWEIRGFMDEHGLSEQAQFTLLDFNEETLEHVTREIAEVKARNRRNTPVRTIKKSVVQLLKGAGRATAGEAYDFVYCAGLFDYIPDRVCKQLNTVLYDMLAPGGLLLVTNVDASNPIQQMLNYLLEWHLIYRDGRQLRALCPDGYDPEDALVRSDETGVNIFLEMRKPLR